MDKKVIDNIVWWIPFKSLRNNIREFCKYIIDEIENNKKSNYNLLNEINHNKAIIELSMQNRNYIHKTIIDNEYFEFYDGISSKTVLYVSGELNSDDYNIKNIEFKEGDIIIDIGGNIGMFSISLAKKFPFIKIYAFEPVKENYENFLKNIELNKIKDGIITVENVAVTKDRRDVSMITSINNTGFSRINDYYKNYLEPLNIVNNIQSITLEDIFNKYNIDKCKFLKIDCEGAEYEILYNANKDILSKIEYLSGEFHLQQYDDEKNTPIELYNYLNKYIKNVYYQFG